MIFDIKAKKFRQIEFHENFLMFCFLKKDTMNFSSTYLYNKNKNKPSNTGN